MSQIKNKFLAQMSTLTLKGNNTGSTANPLDLTVAQVNAILPVFTSSLNGLTPLSGGGTTNYLRADGTWAAPTGTGTVSSVAMSVPSFLSVAGSPITTSGTLAVSLSGTALPILNGGTGQTTAAAAYNALSPMTTTGDIEYESATGIASRLAIGTAGQALSVLGSQTAPSWQTINQAAYANYLAANPGFEVDTTGYAAYANTAQATPVNGTGGSPTVTITRSTSSPLFGTASGLFTHGASNQQGQGFSYDFTIDSAISTSATPCTITGYYSVASGTYDSGLIVWIYDKTNSVLIPCSAATINNVIGAFPIQCEFQPNTNSTSYRLIFHCSTTTATAYTVQFDQLSVRPNTYNPGAAVTDWSTQYSFTPNGYGTVGASYYSTRRVGSELQVRGYFTAGTIAASTASLSMPAGLSIDSTKLGTLSNGTFLGVAIQQQSSLSAAYGTGVGEVIFYDGSDTTKVYIGYQSNSGFVKVNGSAAGVTGQALSFAFSVPIAGWGVTQNLSSDTDTRVCAAQYYCSVNNTPGSNTQINYDTKVVDTHSAVTTGAGSWKFTAPIPGIYQVSNMASTTSTATACYLYKNGSAVALVSSTTSAIEGGGEYLIQLVAGDFIDIRTGAANTFNGGTGLSNQTWIAINRLSGPAQIAASESVNMCASKNAGSQTSSGTYQVIPSWDLVSRDSHNAFNSTTGVYTCPAPGFYSVCGTVQFGNSTTGLRAISIQKNGSNFVIGDLDLPGGLTNGTISVSVNSGVPCLAGDTLSIAAFQSSGGTLAYNTNTAGTNITIFRAGN